jgi:omega-hydroxy-beta-dihydromenaquinone-9 sulfotransferase
LPTKGHAGRSGTTYLHNLLSADEQFAYPNTWRAPSAHTLLLTERYSEIAKLVSPKARLIDNMNLGATVPFEDEYATCGTLCSPFFGCAFPGERTTTTYISPSEVCRKRR